MAHKIIYEQSARDDLRFLYHWIADASHEDIALAYLERIHRRCEALSDFPDRGTPRSDLAGGLRTITFDGKAVIVYAVDAKVVRILRVLHKGRDASRAFLG